MPASPEDHKTSGTKFTAVIDGKPKTFTLPPITEKSAGSITASIVYDAVMNPGDDMAELRLALANLDAAGTKPAVKNALLSLPFAEMMRIVGEWMGESEGSSE